jgi:peptidoglycan hydrolase-like protein with peptidoglycan-binding domain
MHNRSVEELFEWVPIGTMVKIVGPAVKVRRNLKLNMSGADVVVVQKKLRDLGLYNGRADGILGPSTTEAINLFQEKSGLPVTGVIDKETRRTLGLME